MRTVCRKARVSACAMVPRLVAILAIPIIPGAACQSPAGKGTSASSHPFPAAGATFNHPPGLPAAGFSMPLTCPNSGHKGAADGVAGLCWRVNRSTKEKYDGRR